MLFNYKIINRIKPGFKPFRFSLAKSWQIEMLSKVRCIYILVITITILTITSIWNINKFENILVTTTTFKLNSIAKKSAVVEQIRSWKDLMKIPIEMDERTRKLKNIHLQAMYVQLATRPVKYVFAFWEP